MYVYVDDGKCIVRVSDECVDHADERCVAMLGAIIIGWIVLTTMNV